MTDFDIESLARSILVLGEVRVDVGRLSVIGRGEEGKLTPKSMAVLIELARHPMATVTRAELLDRVWPDSMPTPDALSHAVRELRRALGDDARSPSMVETVHGLGYRLMLPVAVERLDRASPSPPSTPPPSDTPPAGPEPSARTDAPASEPLPEPAAPAGAGKRAPAMRARLAAAVLGITVLVAIGAALSWRGASELASSKRGDAAWSSRLITSDPGAEEFPKLSPDGATVAFTRRATADGRYDLAVMSVAGNQPILLTDTATIDELWPVWSPDGTSLAYVMVDGEQCGIQIMAATGGATRRVAACDRVVFSAIDWSPDGSHLLTSLPSASPGRELRVHRVAVAGGAPVALRYEADRPGWDRDPVYSPDGAQIAFRRGLPPDYDVFVMPAQGGNARRLTHVGAVGEGLTWSPDGRDVVFWSRHEGPPAIYRVDARSGSLRPSGLSNASHPHVARRGTKLVFQRPLMRVGIVAADVRDPASPPQAVSESTGSVGFIASSPDHRRLAYVSDRGGFEQVWVHDADGGADRSHGDRLLGRITSLDWSNDGAQLLIVVRRGDADHALALDLASGRFSDLGLVRPLLRDAVLAERPDRIYAIVQGDARPMLARFDRDGGEWRETRSEIPATELIRVPGVPGVFGRTPLRADVILHVTPELASREIELQPRVYGWTAADGAVWYLSSAARAKAELRRFDLATGEDRAVRPMPHHLPRRRATLAMLGERIAVPILEEDAADLGLVERVE